MCDRRSQQFLKPATVKSWRVAHLSGVRPTLPPGLWAEGRAVTHLAGLSGKAGGIRAGHLLPALIGIEAQVAQVQTGDIRAVIAAGIAVAL